jgi:hydrogenase expression/formation protein HypC
MCLAIPGKILSIGAERSFFRNGRVSFGGVIREVNLAYTPDARVNDYVIVHAGFAISVVDEKEAEEIFRYLEKMDQLEAGDDTRGAP